MGAVVARQNGLWEYYLIQYPIPIHRSQSECTEDEDGSEGMEFKFTCDALSGKGVMR